MNRRASERPIYGLLLAGGRSRRMGKDKALLQREGQHQLDYLFDLLAAHTDKAFVATRADQADDPVRRRYPQIVDRHGNIGPVDGILSALEEHPGADWLVIACDLPNLDAHTLAHLRDNADAGPFTAYRSSRDGLPEPLCAIYRDGAADIIRRFVADGIVCPRKILIRSNAVLLELSDALALDNINTPDELADSVLRASP
jgi:molybdopterin-guanine dinucleotide biosynthesis protein A